MVTRCLGLGGSEVEGRGLQLRAVLVIHVRIVCSSCFNGCGAQIPLRVVYIQHVRQLRISLV